MSVRDDLMEAIKDAMRKKDQARLSTLRMMKGALLMKEKAGQGEVSDEDAYDAFQSEIKKRQQTIDALREHGKEEEIKDTEQEIIIIKEFLPQQLSEEEIEERAKAYLEEHPEIDNAGRLTGALKKELGSQVNGRTLNEVCKRVVETK